MSVGVLKQVVQGVAVVDGACMEASGYDLLFGEVHVDPAMRLWIGDRFLQDGAAE